MDLSLPVVFLLLLIAWMIWVRINEAIQRYPPSFVGIPVLGRLPMIIFRASRTPGSNVFRELARDGASKGDVWCTFLGMRRVIGLTSYDAIFDALSRQGHEFAYRPPLGDFVNHRIIGDPPRVGGIIASSGELWQQQRRFALSVMRDLGMGKNATERKIQVEARFLVEELQRYSGKAIEPNPILTRTVSNVISQLVFGFRCSHENYEFEAFNKLIKSIVQDGDGSIFLTVMFPALEGTFVTKYIGNKYLDTDKKMIDFISAKVAETAAQVSDDSEGEPEHFVEAFMRRERSEPEGSNFCRRQLVITVQDLYAAGSETTATFLNWALIYLSVYSDWQKALQEEVNEEFGAVSNISYGDRLRCHKLMAFIDEIQRHASIVPHNLMHSVLEECFLRGHRIPKGCLIIPDLYSVHNDPKLWVDPHQFQPSRFLNDAGKYQPSKYVIPFSIGKRACLGESLARMEIFIFLASILQAYDVDLDEEAKALKDEVFFGAALDIHAPKNHKVVLTFRK